MALSNNPLSWWDRETDEETGRVLRADVREAAHAVWNWVCLKAREVTGDPGNSAVVLELSVKTVSRYLDKNDVPLHSTDTRALVAVACYRAFRRRAQRQRRIELVGGTTELAERLRA